MFHHLQTWEQNQQQLGNEGRGRGSGGIGRRGGESVVEEGLISPSSDGEFRRLSQLRASQRTEKETLRLKELEMQKLQSDQLKVD